MEIKSYYSIILHCTDQSNSQPALTASATIVVTVVVGVVLVLLVITIIILVLSVCYYRRSRNSHRRKNMKGIILYIVKIL